MIRRSTVLFAILLGLMVLPAGLRSQGATAEQYYQYGNQYYAAKNYNYAARYYYAAVKTNPNLAPAYQGLGNCYLLMGRKAEALGYYEKALALNPNNPQLSAYVNSLRAQVAAAPAAGSTGSPQAGAAPAAAASTGSPQAATPSTAAGQSMAQGIALFQQKNYAGAVPAFEQACKETPNDYKPFYYLGYAQYMTRDFKNAAVNFYLANQKQANPTLKAYADRIKASLSPADQTWVDAKVAGGAKATATAAATKQRKAGIRALWGLALFNLKDFNADADTQQKWAQTPYTSAGWYQGGYGLNGEVPKGNMWVGAEPFIQVGSNADIAAGFGIFPVGKYSYTAAGRGLLPTDSPDDAVRNVYKVNADQISLTARYYVGKGKSRPFLGAGAGYYPVKINWASSVASGDGSINFGDTGDFSSNVIGFHGILGGAFTLGTNVTLMPYVQYRMAKAKNFKGSLVDNNGVSTSGNLALYTDAQNNSMIGMDTGSGTAVFPVMSTAAVPTAGLSSKPLEIDMSGIQFGLGVSVAF